MLESIDTPLIAIVAGDINLKMYGPFINGLDALKWYKKQPESVRITFSPLRNPEVKRTYDDFYLPIYLENEGKEFNRLEVEPKGAEPSK